MFTTGSKLFLGSTAFSVVALIALGITNGGDIGWTSTIGIAAAMIALALLAGVNLYVRDCTVPSLDEAARAEAAAAQPAPGASIWPLLGSVGAALLVVGLVTKEIFFKGGVLVLLATLLEWMIQGWSERASADPVYNAGLRKRLLHPLEFPILGAALLGVIIYSFSRVMLWVSKSGGPVAFGVLATLVLLAGILFAYSPGIKTSVAVTVCVIAGLGLVSTGAVMAIDGQREIDKHPTVGADTSICSSNDSTEADDHGSQSVAMKSNVAATITLSGGVLSAHQIGIDQPLTTITLSRSNPSNVIFVNDDAARVRLVAHQGTFDTTTQVNGKFTTVSPVVCTTLVRKDGRQLLTLKYPKSSRALKAGDAYTLEVPGLKSSLITVVVP